MALRLESADVTTPSLQPILNMSTAGQSSTPSSPAGAVCTNCKAFRPYMPCKSNENGNRGVLFAICNSVNKEGKPCKFYRRVPRSNSTSPVLPSSAALSGSLPEFFAPAASAATCAAEHCRSTRIAPDCLRQMCRKHCTHNGGCTSKNHKVSQNEAAPPILRFPAGPIANAPPQLLPTIPPSLPLSPPLETLPIPLHPDGIVDARPEPRFASHLRPIFTEIIAEQQEKYRQQAQVDTDLKGKAQKEKQQVVVYSWLADDSAPSVRVTQDFGWPYLELSAAFLSSVGLSNAGKSGAVCLYDAEDVQGWVTVDVGHILRVKEGRRVFLKDLHVVNCTEFDKVFYTQSQPHTPHLHHSLARERAYVREMHRNSPFSTPCPTAASPAPTLLNSIPSTPAPLPPLMLGPSVSPNPFNDPPEFEEGSSDGKSWPRDYPTIDVAACIREVNSTTRTKRTRSTIRENIFKKHFPRVRFVPATFSDQSRLWCGASESLQDEYVKLGYLPEGLWLHFARRARRGY
ncbi:hypothetical protein CVT26_009292 [Gymnopilus dilepis]|uniref:Uncharacterized protein n=1 Tax=Gymnopilus dilepis TaxID=231916 RepID=A0A409YAI8_9AGAR|nr:hypothetical protein CVT26_009292 [Gymnopilus dilepis]